MKKILFKGSGVAVITPFKNGVVDYDSFKKILNFQIENGTQAIIVCGTTGESATLSDKEKISLISCAVEHVNKRVPIIAGTGSYDTAHAAKLSKEAQSAGADGLLVVTPYYNMTTQNGLCSHFFSIADGVDIPIIVYNVPSRTGLNILPETYAKLAAHENINASKEANRSVGALARTFAAVGDSMNVYCGNDDEIVPFMALGALGVISVMANPAPRETQNICELFFAGRIGESARLQASMTNLCDALFRETSPAPVKHAMKLLGYGNGELRLPLVDIEEKNREFLAKAMTKAGILK